MAKKITTRLSKLDPKDPYRADKTDGLLQKLDTYAGGAAIHVVPTASTAGSPDWRKVRLQRFTSLWAGIASVTKFVVKWREASYPTPHPS